MTHGIQHTARALAVMLAGAAAVTLQGPASAVAAEAPVKNVLSSHIGWEVDTTTKGKVCTVESKDECQSAKPSSEPGGFQVSESVAVDNDLVSAQHGDVYVVDKNNQRVQVLTPAGGFVLMFGWDVNKTKEKESAPQTERNICTLASGNVCQAGVEGAAAGQFADPQSVTVDPNTGNVYVLDHLNWRVQEFTATGEFVLMFGKIVNETKDNTPGATTAEKNVCTALSKDKCKTGEQSAQGSTEPGAFKFAQGYGDLLAMGGPEDLLYVGDEQRVQEFKADGTSVSEPITKRLFEISSAPNSKVTALAVDKPGNVYLVYRVNFVSNVVREFELNGKEIKNFPVIPREPNAEREVNGIALDSSGKLAMIERENAKFFGSFYELGATSLRLITEFITEFGTSGSSGIAFNVNVNGELYAAGGNEVDAYASLPVAELHTSLAACGPGPEHETNATFNCSLKGEVNPEGVSETEAWFQWGTGTPCLLSKETKAKTVNAVEEVSALIEGLRPNEAYCNRLASFDHNVKQPEKPLEGESESFKTPAAPPRILGELKVSFVKSFSAVMSAELNPENTNTAYTFEYGPCEQLAGCPGVARTAVLTSAAYGKIGTTLEATGLQPNAIYHYRLAAVNEQKLESLGSEGSFTTALAPVPQAASGAASAIGATSAEVSGTVSPDGQPATYTFELGVYNGTNTQYGVVFSGSVSASGVPVVETLGLSGLQPGTTYTFRIRIKSGYGTAIGEPVTFTTAGLPSVLIVPTPLEMLPVPTISFPKVSVLKPTPKCKRGYTRDKRSKCVKSKKTAKRSGKGAHRKRR
jgi:hypothetical protein